MVNELLRVAAVSFVFAWAATALDARAQLFEPAPVTPANPYAGLVEQAPIYPTTGAPVVTQWQPSEGLVADPSCGQMPSSASMIVPGDSQIGYGDAQVYYEGDPYPQQMMLDPSAGDTWYWQAVPNGLIYRSYWAGPREPRLGVTLFHKNNGESFWDPTVGARIGLVRFGNGDPIHPQGFQWDVEGAAIARLTLDEVRDLESSDFRGGTYLSYGINRWQFKLGYYHLSSHLGDEFIINNPGSINDRINYVRDAIIAGASFYAVPELRLYAEAGYAFNVDGGAEPWEFQFGTELSKAGPTGFAGSPFLAANVHLREEVNYGGDFTAQAGWMWRGTSGQTVRIGAHYMNGMSTQYQDYADWEEQIGAGLWYDF